MIYYFLQNIYVLSEKLSNPEVLGKRIGYGGVMTSLTFYLSYLLILFVVYYLLRSFGLYKMAKKRGFEKPALCFVPFYSLFMISKLRSDCNAFKKHNFYPIAAVICVGVFILCSAVIDFVYSLNVLISFSEAEKAAPGMAYLTAEMFPQNLTLVTILDNLMSVAKIVYIVFVALLYSDLFRTYAPFNAKTHMVLSIIFTVITGSSFVFGAFTLALSGRPAVNFDEILEKRRVYYGYNTPYGRNGNFGGGNNVPPRSPEEDPFSDFSSNRSQGSSASKNDDPFSEFSDNRQNNNANYNVNNNANNNDPFDEFSSSDNKRSNAGNASDDDSDSLF